MAQAIHDPPRSSTTTPRVCSAVSNVLGEVEQSDEFMIGQVSDLSESQ
jgi:hypothetical protein